MVSPNISTLTKAMLMVVSACIVAASGTDQAQLKQEDDIREVVFRHLLSNNIWAQRGESFDGYYLAVGSRKNSPGPPDPQDLFKGQFIDPSNEFMKRFVDLHGKIQKASACREAALGQMRDRRTGRPALLLIIKSTTWHSDTEVKVEAEYNHGPLSSGGFTYVVKKENDVWKIAKWKQNWIS